jgi:hypothetical protein
MILAKTKSDWFKKYLQDEGGAMTIELRLMVVD